MPLKDILSRYSSNQSKAILTEEQKAEIAREYLNTESGENLVIQKVQEAMPEWFKEEVLNNDSNKSEEITDNEQQKTVEETLKDKGE